MMKYDSIRVFEYDAVAAEEVKRSLELGWVSQIMTDLQIGGRQRKVAKN